MSQFTINQKELLDTEDYSIQKHAGAYRALLSVSSALHCRLKQPCSEELKDFIHDMQDELFDARMHLNSQVQKIINTMEKEM